MRTVLAVALAALVLTAVSVGGAAAQGKANPCERPAGAHNPNCNEHGQFRPPGRGLDHPEPEEPITLPNLVTVHEPSAAAGVYGATGANFGPAPTAEGVTAPLEVVDDGSAHPTEGCGPLVGFTADSIAVIDRGTCPFVQKMSNAQAAGAVAVIVVNNVENNPITMGGTDPSITIPAVMVSLEDGATIKAGLAATGTVSSNPEAE